MPSGRKSPWPRLAVALASVLAALAAGEVTLRAVGFDPLRAAVGPAEQGGRTQVVRLAADPILAYELIPLAHARAWHTDVAINSAGFRDREFPLQKSAGVLRIVALGDSITFGNGMAPEDTWPKQLERQLVAAGRPAEVLNLGIGGYDTLQEVLRLEQLGLSYHPDVVVVCFCVNDVGTFSISAAQLRTLEQSHNPLRRLRLVQFLARFGEPSGEREAELLNGEERYRRDNEGRLADLSGDTDLAAQRASLTACLERHAPLPTAEARDQRFLPLYASTAHLGRLRHAFERLARLRDAHGFKLVLLLSPHLHPAPLEDGWELAYGIVRHEAQRVGVPLLEVRAEFAAAGLERLSLDTGPVHPNARGHALLAEKARAFLSE